MGKLNEITMSAPGFEAARAGLPRIEDVMRDDTEGGTNRKGKRHMQSATDNAKFVLTSAMARAAMYVVLVGLGAYIGSVSNGDTQAHAIYKGLGAAVAVAVLRVGGEGAYDAVRAKNATVKKSDVGAYLRPLPPPA